MSVVMLLLSSRSMTVWTCCLVRITGVPRNFPSPASSVYFSNVANDLASSRECAIPTANLPELPSGRDVAIILPPGKVAMETPLTNQVYILLVYFIVCAPRSVTLNLPGFGQDRSARIDPGIRLQN